MKWIVNNTDGYATRLTAFRGVNLTLVNSSAVDVYYDVEKGGGTINTTLPGVIPVGTKIAASGGQVQFTDAPGEIWVRAISQTQLDVQGDAPSTANAAPMSTFAGDARGSWNVTPEQAQEKKPVQIGQPSYSRISRPQGQYFREK